LFFVIREFSLFEITISVAKKKKITIFVFDKRKKNITIYVDQMTQSNS
jgi:hypothetical protein